MRAPLFAALLAIAATVSSVAAQEQPATVETARVDTREMAETVTVFGQVVAGRQSAVAARVAGVAAQVPVRVGDRVEAGDILARMDTERLEIAVEQAEAEIAIAEAGRAVAEARLDRADKALRRARSLRANSTIAEAQLEDRDSEYAEALGSRQQSEARIKAAQSALRNARYNLENAIVRAPFGGAVLDVETEIGQFVSEGSVVARLVDTGAMEVEANVPARYVQILMSGQKVRGRLDAGEEIELTLRAVLPTEFAATRTRPVRFVLATAAGMAAVGGTVTLDVPVSSAREVTVVPKDALVQAGDGWRVFVDAEGTAEPRRVTIGAAVGDGFEVLDGLAPGDSVVVRGNERLRAGQPIAAGGREGGTPAADGSPDSAGGTRVAQDG